MPDTPLTAQDDGNARVFASTTGRPRIGVTLDVRPDKDNDRYGARISAVSEDGPAAEAGLKEGDIITRFNGVALGGLKADDEDESGPAAKLVELARKLEPGDTVAVEYRRDNEARKTKIVARDLGRMTMGRSFHFEAPEMPRMRMAPEGLPRMPMTFEGGPGEFTFSYMGPGGLDLAELTPELGEYFGTREGLLVLRTPKDSTGELRAGDVILTIDGRRPASEAHARRILGSYDAGESAKLEIMRKQKKTTVTWKSPSGEGDLRWKTPQTRQRVRVERS
jgi:S1-C subfamily serine protease